jgi:hypothetical protein
VPPVRAQRRRGELRAAAQAGELRGGAARPGLAGADPQLPTGPRASAPTGAKRATPGSVADRRAGLRRSEHHPPAWLVPEAAGLVAPARLPRCDHRVWADRLPSRGGRAGRPVLCVPLGVGPARRRAQALAAARGGHSLVGGRPAVEAVHPATDPAGGLGSGTSASPGCAGAAGHPDHRAALPAGLSVVPDGGGAGASVRSGSGGCAVSADGPGAAAGAAKLVWAADVD